MTAVCFDTQLLIWAIQENSSTGQESMIIRTKMLLERLDKSGKKVMIPSIVIGEFLVAFPESTQVTVTNLIARSFIVADYDQKAAMHYARLLQAVIDDEQIQELIDQGKTRAALKADRMIIATALSQNAESIYSHDKGIRTFANGFIDVRDIPDLPIQSEMFKP